MAYADVEASQTDAQIDTQVGAGWAHITGGR